MMLQHERSQLDAAARILEAVARQLHRTLQARIPLEELRSLGGPAIRDVVRRWDGRGRFEAFATQRLRWALLREVRRQALRDYHASFRHDVLALMAGEDAANSLQVNREADVPDIGAERALSVKDLLRSAAARYTLELSACDPDDVEDIAQDVERDAQRMRIRKAAERLPEPLATLVHRYYCRGETVDEMAAELGVSRSTIFDRLQRAVEHLKADLNPKNGADVVPLR